MFKCNNINAYLECGFYNDNLEYYMIIMNIAWIILNIAWIIEYCYDYLEY